MNPALVEIPARLAQRPRDSRGYPIPYSVLIDSSGRPDFRVADAETWVRTVNLRICSLCAQPLGKHLAFVGGPLTQVNRMFTDLPMHRDCAEYALKVCPFLAAPRFRYAETFSSKDADIAFAVNAHVSETRPEVFFMGITSKYEVVRLSPVTLVARAAPWTEVVWWREGTVVAAPSPPTAEDRAP